MYVLRSFALVVMLLLVSPATNAQEEFFPLAADIGDDWTATSAEDGSTSQWPAFARFTAKSYVGPEGARILVGRIEPTDDVSSAMELASGMFDVYLERFTVDPVSETRLAGMEPVDGCAAMRRVDGYDAVIPAIPVGMSLCQAESGIIVLVYVSGKIDDATEHQASDQFLAQMLEP
jgi:hypothetical protein